MGDFRCVNLFFAAIAVVVAALVFGSPAHARETCQGLQCQTETCSSDTCTDGIDTKACHPTHCHKRELEPIGWMKSSDVGCTVFEGKEHCNALDHYTDAYQRGDLCATYGVPFFDRPNGNPAGLLWGEAQIELGEKSEDGKFTHVYVPPGQHKKDMGIMPYSLKALRECG